MNCQLGVFDVISIQNTMQAEYEDTPVAEPPVAPTEEGQEGENEVNDVVDRSDQDEPEDEEGDREYALEVCHLTPVS